MGAGGDSLKFPWSNALLLALILAELATGFLGLVSGSPDMAAFMLAHRIAGYSILAVLIWKGGNILFSLRWSRSAAPRTASLALLALLLATLGLGFWWAIAGPFKLGLFSGVSWHIYVGAVLVPVLAWHSIYHTRGFPVTFWGDRRSFLRLAGLGLAGVALWRIAELGAGAARLRGGPRRFTGSYEAPRISAGVFPVVSWLNDRPEPVDSQRWQISVRGAVERDLQLSYDELDTGTELAATIDCTGGWYSSQMWRGASLAELLRAAGPESGARSVTVTSVTGYYRRFSLDEARDYLLATHVGGRPLAHGHGFPLRLVATGKRGFEWVKWVSSIEVNTTPKPESTEGHRWTA